MTVPAPPAGSARRLLADDSGGVEGGHLGENLPRRLHERHRERGAAALAKPHLQVEHRLETHPKSNNWVGYILSLDGHRYWFSGDGDPNPDIEQVKTDVALICIGGDPYVMNASEAAGVVKKIKPQLAVPNHYGFVVGVASDAETFAREAAPVKVQVLKPVNAFERTGAAAR